MATCVLDEISNLQTNDVKSRPPVYNYLNQLISDFAYIRCADKPSWSGQMDDLYTSSQRFMELSKAKFAKIIIDLNDSHLIPEFEFWYQEYTDSLIIINKSKTGNWHVLSKCFRDNQTFLKLFNSKLNRKLFSVWDNDRFTIEHLFFENESLGYPIQIINLDITGYGCSSYRLIFRGGQTIIYMSRSFELEESFFNLSQLLGFYEITTPKMFTNSDYTWLKPIQKSKSFNNQPFLINNFYYGLIYSLIYTLDSKNDLIQELKCVNQSPFHPSINLLSHNTNDPSSIHQMFIDTQIENFIDGFSCGYRKVLSGKYTKDKLTSFSKLIPEQFLIKLSNQIGDSLQCQNNEISPLIMSEEDLSNQIGLVRQEYCTNRD